MRHFALGYEPLSQSDNNKESNKLIGLPISFVTGGVVR